mmetsp:Transcript_13692/g.20413  ORF Transcript_13692/g.20413 Transcript_13692/m.20413 type:complete len:237 (-) Transcript_13692:340-1050(-)
MPSIEFAYLVLEYLKGFIIALWNASNLFNPIRDSLNSRHYFTFSTAPGIATRSACRNDLFFFTGTSNDVTLISAPFKATVFSSFQQCFNLFIIDKGIKREYPRTIVLSSMSLSRATNHIWFILNKRFFRCPSCKQIIQTSYIKRSLGGIQSLSSTSHFTINQMPIPLLLLTTLTTIDNHPTRIIGTFATSSFFFTHWISIFAPCFGCSCLFWYDELIIQFITTYSKKDLFISCGVH